MLFAQWSRHSNFHSSSMSSYGSGGDCGGDCPLCRWGNKAQSNEDTESGPRRTGSRSRDGVPGPSENPSYTVDCRDHLGPASCPAVHQNHLRISVNTETGVGAHSQTSQLAQDGA